MEQVLFAMGSSLSTSDTEYSALVGDASWVTTEAFRHQIVSTNGKIKKLRVDLKGTPGSGKSYAFTLMVNGSPSSLTTTISDAETSDADMVNEVTVSAGDRVSLRCIPSGTPTSRSPIMWTMVFAGDTPNESLLLYNPNNALHATNTEYANVSGATSTSSTNEDLKRMVCPTAGTLKNLYVWLDEDPGTSPDAYRFTLRVDGVSKSLTVTITANNTTGNDTANSVAVVAGDVLTLMLEPLNTPSATPKFAFGMTFVADINGESLVLGGTSNALPGTNTEYNSPATQGSRTWLTTEASRQMLGQACTLKKLYFLLEDAPGAGKSYTFTVRRNSSSPGSGLVVAISDTATTGNDVSNTVTVSDDDAIAIQAVPASSPTTGDAYWGLVGYIEPVTGYGNKVNGVASASIANINGVATADISKVNGVA